MDIYIYPISTHKSFVVELYKETNAHTNTTTALLHPFVPAQQHNNKDWPYYSFWPQRSNNERGKGGGGGCGREKGRKESRRATKYTIARNETASNDHL